MSRTKVFLSHTAKDKSVVREVFENLENFDDIDTWLDVKKLLPGDDRLQAIASQIEITDYVVFFWSENARNKHEEGNAIGNLA